MSDDVLETAGKRVRKSESFCCNDYKIILETAGKRGKYIAMQLCKHKIKQR